MNSRRYELQKKKQAVRRLSGGSKQSFYNDLADLRKKVALSSGSEKAQGSTDQVAAGMLGKTNPFQTVEGGATAFSNLTAATNAQDSSSNPFSTSIKPMFKIPQQLIQTSEDKPSTDLFKPITSTFDNPFNLKTEVDQSVKPSLNLKTSEKISTTMFESKLSKTFATASENPFSGSVKSFVSKFQPSEEKQVFENEGVVTDIQKSENKSSIASNPFAVAVLKPSPVVKAPQGELMNSAKEIPAPSRGLTYPKAEQHVSFSIKSAQLSSVEERREKRFQTTLKGATKSEIDKSITALRLKDVPADLLDKTFLKNYYTAFGDVKRVFIHPQTSSAILTFSTHEAAASAKANGKVLKEGYDPISIFWKAEKSDGAKVKPAIPAQQPAFVVKGPTQELSSSSIIKLVQDFVATFKNIQCHTAGEKFELLDRIDQKIREGLKKETDINKAIVTRGTCPDICPEKERYLREDRRRLATYELLAGTENANTLEGEFSLVDHNKAVKEYSRSSADQEEPLSHELRPVNTLRESMNYIIWNVLDIGSSNWAEWYDYVWNRTRAIRKDITQQNLKCGQSIQLMEQCARFHIVCAHLLCEEDINVFDSKINNENMTKCLQSLKQMYYDLLHDKNEVCHNEAEFRAYQVLLNLNDGNILCEVMSFRKEVRQSPHVKFALSVYAALSSNNYVRFLHLLRNAPYLVACLMHRYLNQIRASGLRILNKAYNQPSSRPLRDIARLFVFDSEDLAAEFCQHYSLSCQEGSVVFSKSTYLESEQAFRSVKCGMITAKRNSTIGQIVHGEPHPSSFMLKPQSVSFNDNGTYNGTYHEVALRIYRQQDSSPSQPKQQSVTFTFNSAFGKQSETPLQQIGTTQELQPFQQSAFQQFSAQPSLPIVGTPVVSTVDTEAARAAELENIQLIKQSIKDICKEMLLEAVDYNVKTATAQTMTLVHQVRQDSVDMYRDVLFKVVEGEVKEVSRRTYLLEKRREIEFQKAALSRLSTDVESSILESTTSQLIKEIALNVHQKELEKSESDRREIVLLQLSNDMIDNHIYDAVTHISHDVINSTLEARKTDLTKKQRIIERKSQKKFFNRWLALFQARCQLKESLNDFPPAPLLTSVTKSIAELTGQEMNFTSSYDNVNHSIALPDGSVLSCDTKESLSRKRKRHKQAVEDYHRRVKMERDAWSTPISLSDLIVPKRRLANKLGQILWKLSVSFPIETSCWTKRIKNKLGLDKHEKFTSSIQLDSIVKESFVIRSNVEIFTGIGSDSFGSSGLVFVLDLHTVSWKKEKKRLKQLIDSRPYLPLLPVAILAIDYEQKYNAEDIHVLLHLDEAHLDANTKSFTIYFIDIDNEPKSFEKQIIVCLQDLFNNQPPLPLLEWDTLSTYVEKGIVSFYKGVLLDPSAVNSIQIEPSIMIDVYNHIILHLIEVATRDELTQISWPPPQLTTFSHQDLSSGKQFISWNSQKHFSLLSKALEQLVLPDLDIDAIEDSWERQLDTCITYLQQIDLNLHPNRKELWAQLLNRVLSAISKSVSLPCKRRSHLAFPWSTVISECIFHLLDYFCSSALYHDVDQLCNVVFYRQKDFDSFQPPTSLLTMSFSSREASYVERSTLGELSRSDKINASVIEIDSQLDEIIKRKNSNETKETSCLDVNETLHEFESDLCAFKENLHSKRFQNSKFKSIDEAPSLEMDEKQRKIILLCRQMFDEKSAGVFEE